MGTKDNREFKLAIRDIAEHAVNVDNPYGKFANCCVGVQSGKFF